jgi:hypothetical protein
MKQHMELVKERSMKEVSMTIVNFRMHDSLTVFEAFLALVSCKRLTPMNSLKSEKW